MHATTPICIVVGLEFTVFQRNLKQWQERPWTYVCECYRESNQIRFDSYSVKNSVLIISHITFRDCRLHIFSDNLFWNSCIRKGGDFTSWSILKGREIYRLGLLKGPVGLIDEWYGFEKSRKRSVFEMFTDPLFRLQSPSSAGDLNVTKKEKSKDYCKADLKQRVLFFYNNISAGHTSLLQVYRCYWTYVGITILYRWRMSQ